MSLELQQFLAGYLAEVEEHLSSSTQKLNAIDASARGGQANPHAVRELFRSLHTIKGLSAMVGVEPVVALAHEMESLLRAADRAGGALSQEAVDAISDGVRAIERQVRAIAAGQEVPTAPAGLVERLAALQAMTPAPAASATTLLTLPADVAAKLSAAEQAQLAQGVATGKRAVRVDFVPTPSRAATGLNITTVRDRVGRVAELVKVYPVSLPKSDAAPGGLGFALIALYDGDDDALRDAAGADAVVPLSTAAAPAAVEAVEFESTRGGSRLVRVDVARLDDAMEKLSSLVVNRFRLTRAIAAMRESGTDVRALADIMNENGRQLRDLRAAIMRARMVPMAELLERIPLLVRGLERATGKRVNLTVDAGRAELDKAVAERLFPAIVHLVRNAVDHAIETPEERVRAGKPEIGRVEVTCWERGNNQLELTVSDDGRGVDRARVAARAGRAIADTPEALLEVLTAPGFSTRERASTTSGRGLGMDIVKRIAVDELGGELHLSTTPGGGTQFSVRVPLTITIVDAFSFLAGRQPFVVPVTMVEEIVEIEESKAVRGPQMARRGTQIRVYERRGEPVPIVALDELFAIPRVDELAPAKAMVVRRHGAPFAFAVHRMLGQQEVVVRPLEDPLVKVPGVTGSTDLGDGRATLVLDLWALSSQLAEARA
ncbi:MAG TPA: chemotaxis protein CheW [Polyangia bacterium]|nr:chemotaxis protein CheW [Polyangia bacterium]